MGSIQSFINKFYDFRPSLQLCLDATQFVATRIELNTELKDTKEHVERPPDEINKY
jgi:hypothetical protein